MNGHKKMISHCVVCFQPNCVKHLPCKWKPPQVFTNPDNYIFHYVSLFVKMELHIENKDYCYEWSSCGEAIKEDGIIEKRRVDNVDIFRFTKAGKFDLKIQDGKQIYHLGIYISKI